MNIQLNLIHYEWTDFVILDFKTNRLYRKNIDDEHASFCTDKNILIINWDKWGTELFITYSKDYKYYACSKSNFYHEEWEGICYVDYINKLVLRDGTNDIANFNLENDEFIIKWSRYDYMDFPDFSEYININTVNESIPFIEKEDKHEDEKVERSYHEQSPCIENQDKYEVEKVESSVCIENEDKHENANEKNSVISYTPSTTYRIFSQSNSNRKIPNFIHFVYGFKPQNEEFELYRYIAIKSAIDVNNPEKVYFYYFYEPFGYWWDKIKPFLTLEHIHPPKEIFGNKISHYAHQADIIRLKKIIERGGIYLDIDTICLKSFNDLLDNDFVMAIQNNSDGSDTYGLCNAVMLSAPNSVFGTKWFDTYRTFRSNGRDENWDEHSVLMPLKLSKDFPEHIKILGKDSFFYPLWYDIKNVLFNENINKDEYKKIINNNYCIHLWDTYSNEYLKTLNENIIFSKNTIYNIFCRKFLRNRISLVLLTYNRDDITIKCLESYLKCLDKTYIEELIILDNNSNKSLTNYLKEYQYKHEKIKLIFSDENLGVCHGRIVLFKEAIGDIIISIDSDAFLLNNDFFDRIMRLLYDESNGIIGISGAYLKSWSFGTQEDISENDPYEYYVDHIAGCCQCFRRELFIYGFGLDYYYGKFWVEDTDLSMQSLEMNKNNIKINQQNYLDHHWGGSGRNFEELFHKNWEYFSGKWRGRVLYHLT